METPKEIKGLVDQLGQALAHAIMTDEVGQNLIRQIQETGFDVGVLLEATVALHPKCDDDSSEEAASDGGIYAKSVYDSNDSKGFEWSEEDKVMMCNLRISLD